MRTFRIYFKIKQMHIIRNILNIVIGIIILFLICSTPYFYTISIGIVIYIGMLAIFVIANFGLATFMDPGIYPRGNYNNCYFLFLKMVSLKVLYTIAYNSFDKLYGPMF